MARVFSSGEKVFAKMRGYPPWPARIEGIADSTPGAFKYHILFYGTKQIGICKSRDLFPYLENKNKYGKVLKAKGFKEALEQIEGLAPVPEMVPKVVNMKFRNGIIKEGIRIDTLSNNINNYIDQKKESNRQKKSPRKINETNCLINGVNLGLSVQSPEKHKKPTNSNKQISADEESDSIVLELLSSKAGRRRTPVKLEQKPQNEVSSVKEPIFSDSKNDAQKLQKQNNNSGEVVCEVKPGNHVSCQEEFLPQELSHPVSTSLTPKSALSSSSSVTSNTLSSQLVSRSGRVIKRKLFHDEAEDTTSKRKKTLQQSEDLTPKAKCVQKLSSRQIQNSRKRTLQTAGHLSDLDEIGSSVPCHSGQSELYINLLNERDCFNARKEKKQSARRWLATENCLTRLDTLVRAQLGMNRANPQQCIRFLEDMSDLDLRPLMLKKHPEVVETIKRLRRYVGNAGAWKLSEEQKKEFEEQAMQIRLKAECIFDKFKSMFAIPDTTRFLEVFADSVVAFQEKTHDWPLPKIYALVTEPKPKIKKSPKPSNSPRPLPIGETTPPPSVEEKAKKSSVKKEPKIQTPQSQTVQESSCKGSPSKRKSKKQMLARSPEVQTQSRKNPSKRRPKTQMTSSPDARTKLKDSLNKKADKTHRAKTVKNCV